MGFIKEHLLTSISSGLKKHMCFFISRVFNGNVKFGMRFLLFLKTKAKQPELHEY